MRTALFIFIIVHGLIHVMGFAKAFDLGIVAQLTKPITRPVGIIWLITAILFLLTGLFFVLKQEHWFLLALLAIVFSQILIIMHWSDAKFGTIANLILALVTILNFGSYHFEKGFKKDVQANQKRIDLGHLEILTESDIQLLPTLVKDYLHYVGVVNKPKVKNMRVVFQGQMREKGKDYFPFTSVQYNYFEDPARLFFMKAKMFGVTVPGYHHYMNGNAVMDIRLFGLFSIVKKSGDVMDKAETVTLFNDMCLLAPATLIDKRIQWENINDSSCKATFTNGSISISAILYFNKAGQLVNFISNDRSAVNEMKQYPFLTPISEYANFNGYQLMAQGDAVWRYPEGDFVYGKFDLKAIEYNCTEK